MGASFAVVHLSTLEGYEFALPTIKEKTGLKHQDFNIIVDPDLPLEKASLEEISLLIVCYMM